MGYDGFISYSHAADDRLAPALQRGLQRLAKRWNSRRALHVFRDETGLSTNPHLWSAIESALDETEWFVLLASPEAAGSEWVNREVSHWLATKSADRILPVVTDGVWAWDATRGDFGSESTAVPDAFRGALREEPRHLDLRWARTETDLDLRNSRFRAAVADLAAPMHGIAKDELEGEDIRQHRRARRLARSAVGALAVLMIVAVLAASLAITQRNRADEAATTARRQAEEARRQANIAKAERLAAVALADVDTRLDLALLLAAEGYRLHDDASTRHALLTVLTTNHAVRLVRTVHNLPEGIIAGDISPNGKLAVFGTGDGTVHFVDTRRVRDLADPVTEASPPFTAVFSPDSAMVATGAPGGVISFWDPRSGRKIGPQIPGGALNPAARLGVLAFSKDHRVLASADTDNNAVRLFSTASGAELADPIAIDAPVDLAYRADGRAIVAGGRNRVIVIDAGSMRKTHDLSAPASNIVAVALSSDGRWAIGGDDLGRLHVWDLVRGGASRTFRAHDQAILDIVADPHGGHIATSASDRRVRRWDTASLTEIGQPITGFRDLPFGLLYADDGSLVTRSATEVTQWDLGTRPLSTPLTDVGMARSGPPGHVLVTDGARRVVRMFDPDTRRPSGRPIVVSDTIAGLGLDAGSARYAFVVTRHDDTRSKVSIFVVATGRRVASADLPAGMTVDGLSPDGRSVLIRRDGPPNTFGCCVTVSDVGSRVLALVPTAPGLFPFGAFSGAFTPDGRGAILFGQNGPDASIVRTVDRDGGAAAQYDALGVPDQGPATLAEGPNDLVAISASNQIQLLRAPALTPIGGPLFGDVVRRMAFSPDGALLATAATDAVTLWDIATHQQLGALDVGANVEDVALLGGDHPSLLTSADDHVSIWDLDPSHWSSLACDLAGRQLTPDEWRVNVGETPYRPVCTTHR